MMIGLVIFEKIQGTKNFNKLVIWYSSKQSHFKNGLTIFLLIMGYGVFNI